MALSDFFISTQYNVSTHIWSLNSHNCQCATLDALAAELATEIVRFRCRRCTHHFDAWKNKIENNTPLPQSSNNALHAFLTPTFGEPWDYFQGTRIDHLEGFVGEWLWYFLAVENPTEDIVHTLPPGFKSTDPGGDAFIVHRLSSSDLMFRLWEMKKFAPRSQNSSQQLSTTVNTAYSQLNSKATEYLARITATEQEFSDPELEDFFGKLPDLWIDASPQAAAGVSIATSLNHILLDCFDNFGQQFPNFIHPVRLRGVLTGIDDFSAVALKVQEYIWKGL